MQEEHDPVHRFVYSREMVDFVSHANTCCQFLEELKKISAREFILESVKRFPALYAAFHLIGDTQPLHEGDLEPSVSEQDWAELYQQIAALLGPHNEVLRVAGEEEFDRSEVLSHTISEDLADVYQELRDFTVIYSRGLEEFMNDAAWELKERFAEHWGMKLLRALSALHMLYVKEIDPEEER